MLNIHYQFKNKELLDLALTHSSLSSSNNERLEFLGDSILNFITTDWLFRKFPNEQEGTLSLARSKLVSKDHLYTIAQKINVEPNLKIAHKQQKLRNQHRLADAVEAILGAIFLDGGLQPCQELIIKWMDESQLDLNLLKDAKSSLQEWCQLNKIALPLYQVTHQHGPDHAPKFIVQCSIDERKLKANGHGISKKEAEQMAAENILKIIQAS